MSARDFIEMSPIAQKHLGYPGAMLVHSKAQRNSTTICNAALFSSSGRMIWSGDLDINKSREKLIALEQEMGATYILFESDGLDLVHAPTLTYLKKYAQVVIELGVIYFSEHFVEWMRLQDLKHSHHK